MSKLCYWCKHEPCTCRTIADDYPKYMIKYAPASQVCKFCKRTECVCDLGYCLFSSKPTIQKGTKNNGN